MNDFTPSLEFSQLLTSHQARLFAFVLKLLGDPGGAKDVMQETNLVLWRKAADFKLGTNFGTWMFKAARYQVLNYRRAKGRDGIRGPVRVSGSTRPSVPAVLDLWQNCSRPR